MIFFFKLLGNQINYFLVLFVAVVSQVIIVTPFVIYTISTGGLNHSARLWHFRAERPPIGFGDDFFMLLNMARHYPWPCQSEGIGLILAGALAGVFCSMRL